MDDCGIISLEGSGFSIHLDDKMNITCSDSVQLLANVSYSGEGELNYKWTPNTGLSADDIPNPVAFVDSTSTYTLSVISPDHGERQASITIIVVPIEISIEDKQITCGSTRQLNTYTNYNGSGEVIYFWTPSTGLSSNTLPNPTVNVIEDISYTVQAIISETCQASTDISITVIEDNYIPEICVVSVNEDNHCVIGVKKPESTSIDSFFIYRETTTANQYEKIGGLSYSGLAEFTDTASKAWMQAFTYKISKKDICGNESELSPNHKSIHLTISKGIGSDYNLQWGSYIGTAIASYKIFRGTSREDLEEITTVSGNNNSYTDSEAPGSNVYYQVRGFLEDPCNYILKSNEYATVSSNILNTSTGPTNVIDEEILPVVVFPNPVKESFSLSFEYEPGAQIDFYDSRGKLIRSEICKDFYDISNFSSGLYFIRIIESEKTLLSKLIKE
jgi:hypothetical protein